MKNLKRYNAKIIYDGGVAQVMFEPSPTGMVCLARDVMKADWTQYANKFAVAAGWRGTPELSDPAWNSVPVGAV